jgi:hypothetical protein
LAEGVPILFDEVYAVVDVFNNIVLILIVSVNLEMEGDVINTVTDFYMKHELLVSAEAVIIARMPYSLRMAAF